MHNLVTIFIQCPPKEFNPTTTTPFLPYQNIALLIHEKVVAGDIHSHIYTERRGLSMEERLYKKKHANHDLQHIIDWSTLCLAVKTQDTVEFGTQNNQLQVTVDLITMKDNYSCYICYFKRMRIL